MKLPKFSDLSEEQLVVYEEAPFDGNLLITGPPGTGKTVMALWRGKALASKGMPVTVSMFNKVLSRYTGGSGEGCDVRTLYSWAARWWKKAYYAPKLEFENYKPNWDWAFKTVVEKNIRDVVKPEKLKWGHLVIDEGQDFSASMYSFLRLNQRLANDPRNTGLTILADQNQRLTEENSTIKQIRDNLVVPDERAFNLTINFRNTAPIARLAREFYCGHSTGIPEIPKREGDMPRLVRFATSDKEMQYIANYVRNRYETEEIGIIVLGGDAIRKRVFSDLKRLLSDTRASIQTYTYKDSAAAKDLRFDEPGTVTVLNRQSAKGLEFDAVFMPQLQVMRVGDTSSEQAKMTFYVMTSRARKRLFLSYEASDKRLPECLEILPGRESELMIWEGV